MSITVMLRELYIHATIVNITLMVSERLIWDLVNLFFVRENMPSNIVLSMSRQRFKS